MKEIRIRYKAWVYAVILFYLLIKITDIKSAFKCEFFICTYFGSIYVIYGYVQKNMCAYLLLYFLNISFLSKFLLLLKKIKMETVLFTYKVFCFKIIQGGIL